jgi:hypothetical protein
MSLADLDVRGSPFLTLSPNAGAERLHPRHHPPIIPGDPRLPGQLQFKQLYLMMMAPTPKATCPVGTSTTLPGNRLGRMMMGSLATMSLPHLMMLVVSRPPKHGIHYWAAILAAHP